MKIVSYRTTVFTLFIWLMIATSVLSEPMDVVKPLSGNLLVGSNDGWPQIQRQSDGPMHWNIISGDGLFKEPVALASVSLFEAPSDIFLPVFLIVVAFFIMACFFWHLRKTLGKGPLSYDFDYATARSRLILFNGLLVVLVVVSAWMILENIREKSRQGVRQALQTVMNVSQNALTAWADEHTQKIFRLAKHSELKGMVEALLDEHLKQGSVHGSRALGELRAFFRQNRDLIGSHGFFVVDPNGLTVGSMRDANIGSGNLIWRHRPDLFSRVIGGETLFIPPIPSDVPLAGAKPIGDTGVPPTMFFASPVRGGNGEVVAVLARRLDPHGTFSVIPGQGRMGNTGETYLFDQSARFLTRSRFEVQLLQVGLIPQGSQNILTVSVRDPGRNLLESGALSVSPETLPFTEMAENAIGGRDGFNSHGYRDYRGIRVIGAWAWSDTLGIGIATEIEASEAYAAFKGTRLMVVSLLGVTILLVFFYTSANLYMARQTTATLKEINENLEETVRRRTDELRRSDVHFKSLVTNIPGVVYRCALDEDWTMGYMSDRIESLCGYPASDFLGNSVRSFESVIVPADREMVGDAVRRGVSRQEPYTVEYRILHRNGTIIWVHEQGRAMMGEESEVVHLDGFIMDISESKEKDKYLRFVTYVVENAGDAVFWIESESAALYFVNKVACERLGYSKEELLGMTVHDIDPLFDKNMWPRFKRVLENKRVTTFETQHLSKQGVIYPVEVTASAVEFEGTIFFAAFARDIADRKRAEERMLAAKEAAEAASLAKGAFLSHMSHEFRTPLNAIMGYSKLMQGDGNLSEDHRRSLDIINRSGEHLLDLINNILEMSRVESGRTEINSISFNIYEMLEDLESMFRVQAKSKGIAFSFFRGDDVPMVVKSDAGKVRQVLINLVGNALKFTEVGEISVGLACKGEEETDTFILEFKVQDSGVGIPEEDVGKIFEAFEQAEAGKVSGGGTGLGLSISRHYARLLNGNITVASTLGEGSTFIFTLQVQPGRMDEVQLKPDPTLLRRIVSDQLPIKVIVVDEDERERAILERLLANGGVEVKAFDTVPARGALPETWEPHAAFLGLTSPIAESMEMIEAIRNLSDKNDVVIFALGAALGREANHHNLSGREVADIIDRPFHDQNILGALHYHLGVQFQPNTMGGIYEEGPCISEEMLSGLPDSLRKDLWNAVVNGELEVFKQLLSVDDKISQDLVFGLKSLADIYAYGDLQRLLSPTNDEE